MVRRKIIVDLDGSADNCIALMLALHAADVEVAAVTCVWGNATVEAGATQVCKLLDALGVPRREVPVFLGAREPLIREPKATSVGNGEPDAHNAAVLTHPRVSSENAAIAIARLLSAGRRNEEVWQIVALGPLTNIALALRLDPWLFTGVGCGDAMPGFVVMGGALEAKGNSGMASEFNWHSDPEASLIVTQSVGRQEPRETAMMHLIPWEVTLATALNISDTDHLLGLGAGTRGEGLPAAPSLTIGDTAKQKTVQQVLRDVSGCGKHFHTPFLSECFLPGACAMAAALDFSGFVKKSKDAFVTVETSGMGTRGCCLIDWYGTAASRRKARRWLNASIATATDRAMLLGRLFRMVDQPHKFLQ